MSDAKLSLIPQEYVQELWPLVERDIKRAADESDGLITVEDHKHGVLNGHRQLWMLTNEDGTYIYGAGVTEIVNGICFIWALGGKQMSKWWDTQDTLELWARHHRCKRIEFVGRKGWTRPLRARGYRERLVVLQKELR